jgi:protein-tyrosine phosphatase
MMEVILRDAIAASGGPAWQIESAGTHATDGMPMHDEARSVLTERGFTVRSFRARRLSLELIDAADLILTAESGHRSAVVALRPGAVNRAFTLVQFARLADAAGPTDGDGGVANLVARARRARSRSRPGDDELPDPIGGPRLAFEVTADRIADAVATIAAARGIATPGAQPTIHGTPSSATL